MSRVIQSLRVVLVGLLASAAIGSHAAELALLPYPATLELQRGSFTLPGKPIIRHAAGDSALHAIATTFAERLADACDRRIEVREGKVARSEIELRRDATLAEGGEEAYRLEVDQRGIVLAARHDAGLRHATTTLLQLICAAERDRLPALHIEDAPHLQWRGLMLDSARHFQSPEHIRRLIDAMALHKLNVLHWHLTDDQAWRLEILKYPKLTDVGAWRVPAGAAQRAIDPATGKAPRYGGYYTQQTVRELIAYAAARGIQIVPEIEMPGHASAAIAAYPELGAQPGVVTAVPGDWGIYPNAFALDAPTFEFIENVLREVIALFPSHYLHVGGDEVEADQWKASAAGRALAARLGSDEGMALQAHFTERVANFLEANDRRLVGWDEILTPGLAQNAVVMSWRGIEGALKAASQGHDTVLSPWPALYFDNRQSTLPDEPPGRVRVVSLRDVYDFEPIPEALDADAKRHVLGLQGNVWTEHIRTEPRFDHMSFPRVLAVAERGWTAHKRAWPQFAVRVARQAPLLSRLGVQGADSPFAVDVIATHRASGERVEVELANQASIGEIRYTIDGTEPGPHSLRYAGAALDLALPVTLRANSFLDARPLAASRERRFDHASKWSRTSSQLTLCSEGIPLMLEDDAPLQGDRAVFTLDIQNPCWRWPALDTARLAAIEVRVGQLPFNFQIGAARDAIRFPTPATIEGELLVFEGQCEGEPWLRLPLAAAASSDGLTTLRSEFAPVTGTKDICLRFAQAQLEPMWAIDRIRWIAR